MCMVLSRNCCAVTIFEYSTTEVTLPSCLSVPSEHFASQSKWQSADLDLVKLAKKRKSVWPALFRGNVYIQSDTISNVSAILGRKCTARQKVNQNTRPPSLSENLNLEKNGFLQNCSVTFNVSSKQFRFKVCFVKCVMKVVYRQVFLLLYQYADKINLHPYEIVSNTGFKHDRVFNSFFILFLKPE